MRYLSTKANVEEDQMKNISIIGKWKWIRFLEIMFIHIYISKYDVANIVLYYLLFFCNLNYMLKKIIMIKKLFL